MSAPEPILEPDLPIIDAHHHLMVVREETIAALRRHDDRAAAALARIYSRHPKYLLDEFQTDVRTGHNVRATVFVEVHAMYRASGPEHMRSVGEVEFANGIAAMSASGLFGDTRVCAGIVGGVDLRLGDGARHVLEAQMQAGGERYRGIRASGVGYDESLRIIGGVPHLLLDATFRRGFRHLQALGLSYDVFLLEPQLPDLIDLARAFPGVQIILNHVGTPVGIGARAGTLRDRFPIWRDHIRTLSGCPNVAVKLGGLGMPWCGLPSLEASTPASSQTLAEEWRPYLEWCIEVFGAHRCMFESNYPVDSATAAYPVIWNAFKRIAQGASPDEKAALFSGTATRIYKLEL